MQTEMENPPSNSNNNNNNDIIIRRSSSSSASNSSSPEFEFFTSFSHQTTLHSADELFSGGILVPLHRLTTEDHPLEHSNNIIDNDKQQEDTITEPPTDPPLDIPGSDLKPTPLTTSKRWKDIFKKKPDAKKDDLNKKKKKDRNSAAAVGTAELNINLWPFSRSRSAGTGGSKPRVVVGNRKVSSAPCSRSNSTGDKYRKWPSSPGRPGGVHLGRSSPVWQAKRFGQSRSLHDTLVRNTAEKSSRPAKNGTAGAGGNGKVLNINVPMCIGYRQRMSCRSDVVKDNINAARVAGGNDDVTPVNATAGEGGATGLFNLRSLFTKKVF